MEKGEKKVELGAGDDAGTSQPPAELTDEAACESESGSGEGIRGMAAASGTQLPPTGGSGRNDHGIVFVDPKEGCGFVWPEGRPLPPRKLLRDPRLREDDCRNGAEREEEAAEATDGNGIAFRSRGGFRWNHEGRMESGPSPPQPQPPAAAGMTASTSTDSEDFPVDASPSIPDGARGSDSAVARSQPQPPPVEEEKKGEERKSKEEEGKAAMATDGEDASLPGGIGSDSDHREAPAPASGESEIVAALGIEEALGPQLQPMGGSAQNDRVSHVEVVHHAAGIHAAAVVHNPARLNAAEGCRSGMQRREEASCTFLLGEEAPPPPLPQPSRGTGLGRDFQSLLAPRPTFLTPRRNVGVIGDGRPARVTPSAAADAPTATAAPMAMVPLLPEIETAPPRRDGPPYQSLRMVGQASGALDLQQLLPPRRPSLRFAPHQQEPRTPMCILSRDEVEMGWAALLAARRELHDLRLQNHQLAGALGEASLYAHQLQQELSQMQQLSGSGSGGAAPESMCKDCSVRPAVVTVSPCHDTCLCRSCYLNRQSCPSCGLKINFQYI